MSNDMMFESIDEVKCCLVILIICPIHWASFENIHYVFMWQNLSIRHSHAFSLGPHNRMPK